MRMHAGRSGASLTCQGGAWTRDDGFDRSGGSLTNLSTHVTASGLHSVSSDDFVHNINIDKLNGAQQQYSAALGMDNDSCLATCSCIHSRYIEREYPKHELTTGPDATDAVF